MTEAELNWKAMASQLLGALRAHRKLPAEKLKTCGVCDVLIERVEMALIPMPDEED